MGNQEAPRFDGKMSRRGFIVGGLAALGAAVYGGYRNGDAGAMGVPPQDIVSTPEQQAARPSFQTFSESTPTSIGSEMLDIIKKDGKLVAASGKIEVSTSGEVSIAFQELLPTDANGMPVKMTPKTIDRASTGALVIAGGDEKGNNVPVLWVSPDGGFKGTVYTSFQNTGAVKQVKLAEPDAKEVYLVTYGSGIGGVLDPNKEKMLKIKQDGSIINIGRDDVFVDLDTEVITDPNKVSEKVFYSLVNNSPGYYKNTDNGTDLIVTQEINLHEGIPTNIFRFNKNGKDIVWHMDNNGRYGFINQNFNDIENSNGDIGIDISLSAELLNAVRVTLGNVSVDSMSQNAVLALGLQDGQGGNTPRFMLVSLDNPNTNQQLLPALGLPVRKLYCIGNECSPTQVKSVSILEDKGKKVIVAKIENGSVDDDGYYYLDITSGINVSASWKKVLESKPPVNRISTVAVPGVQVNRAFPAK